MMLKEKALKMFDNDYDALYHMVKNETLGDGRTFRELMATYLSDTKLSEIETELPALTIFIPTLPNNTFSADIWNTQTEIPQVAYISKLVTML